MKTIKEASEYYAQNNFVMQETNHYKALLQGFGEGAKWQQERMYSEEEVISLLDFVNDRLPDLYSRFTSEEELKEWFLQFKKK